MQLENSCPCGHPDGLRVAKYDDCCARWIVAGAAAPDAQALMRSRYSAFVLQNQAYLLATWHPTERPTPVVFEPGIKWLGLELRGHWQHDADHASVEFVARYKPAQGPAQRQHERSRFVREGGLWLYVDGLPVEALKR